MLYFTLSREGRFFRLLILLLLITLWGFKQIHSSQIPNQTDTPPMTIITINTTVAIFVLHFYLRKYNL